MGARRRAWGAVHVLKLFFSWLILAFFCAMWMALEGNDLFYIGTVPVWPGVFFLIKNYGPFAFAQRVEIEATGKES
jgi:hypothetical protein